MASLYCPLHDRQIEPVEGWRDAVHFEFDFRNLFYSKAESALNIPMDKCSLAVIRNEYYKYVHFAAMPPLLFDLKNDPGQFKNLAAEDNYARVTRDYAARMLDWRLGHAERTLTGFTASPEGLLERG